MSGKVWQPSDWKKFAKHAEMGRPYYTVSQIATNLSPWEDPEMWVRYVFTDRLPFTGSKATAGGTPAGEVCRNHGPVYEEVPANMRRLGSPGPQVAGPLGSNDYQGVIDEEEIRGLEKQARQGSNPRTRGPINRWRV